MKISTGPLRSAIPNWGLAEGTTTAFVSGDSNGRPDVLIAQIICGAAMSGVKTLMLLPTSRQDDDVWARMLQLLSGGNGKMAAQAMGHMPIVLHAESTGRDRVGDAELVYAPGLTHRQLNALRPLTGAPFITTEETPPTVTDVIRVGGDILKIDSTGIEVPVLYDPGGPMYRPA